MHSFASMVLGEQCIVLLRLCWPSGVVRKFFRTPTLTIGKNSTYLPRSCAIQWAAGNLGQTQAVRGQHNETMN